MSLAIMYKCEDFYKKKRKKQKKVQLQYLLTRSHSNEEHIHMKEQKENLKPQK